MMILTTSNSYAQASFETIDGLRYLLDSDAKTATVVASNGEKYSGDIVIPEKVKGSDGVEYSVVKIGDKAFFDTEVTSVKMGNKITLLGDYCFSYCHTLKNIEFSPHITSFGKECFRACSSLDNLLLPSSLLSISERCFEGCQGLTSIDIPSKVRKLEYGCFNNCGSLKSIILSNSLTTLEDFCLNGCQSLVDICLPTSLTSLGKNCFAGCGFKKIKLPSSLTSISDYCFRCCFQLNSVVLPASVSSLGEGCFEECDSLTYIELPSSISSLGRYCFSRCSSLEIVKLTEGVETIGQGCFNRCSNLTGLVLPATLHLLGDGCFSECTKLEYIKFSSLLPSNTLKCDAPTTCVMYVPADELSNYKSVLSSKYSYIYSWNPNGSIEDKPSLQCAVPTILYSEGNLKFHSSTPNAEYHYTITDSDVVSDMYSADGTVTLSASYNITAYATADGYKPSEKATATLYWVNANLEDTTPTNVNQAKTRGVVISSRDGIVTLSGLDNGEKVGFYTVDGKQIGVANAIGGNVSYAVSESMIIVKVATLSFKVAVK